VFNFLKLDVAKASKGRGLRPLFRSGAACHSSLRECRRARWRAW
jgi:hypothetical protein